MASADQVSPLVLFLPALPYSYARCDTQIVALPFGQSRGDARIRSLETARLSGLSSHQEGAAARWSDTRALSAPPVGRYLQVSLPGRLHSARPLQLGFLLWQTNSSQQPRLRRWGGNGVHNQVSE